MAVVNWGVTPEPVTIGGATEPDHKIGCAPVGGVAFDCEVEKKLTVPEPPVPAGNVMFAAGLIKPEAAADQPPVVRATFIRVYMV